MSNDYTISEVGLQLIKDFEGFRSEERALSTGKRVVGYGHVVEDEDDRMVVTESEAEFLLRHDLEPVEALINNNIYADITQNQFDALCSLGFSIGTEALLNSDIFNNINQSQVIKAANQFDDWQSGDINGEIYVVDALVRRRTTEKALFLRPSHRPARAPRLEVVAVNHARRSNEPAETSYTQDTHQDVDPKLRDEFSQVNMSSDTLGISNLDEPIIEDMPEIGGLNFTDNSEDVAVHGSSVTDLDVIRKSRSDTQDLSEEPIEMDIPTGVKGLNVSNLFEDENTNEDDTGPTQYNDEGLAAFDTQNIHTNGFDYDALLQSLTDTSSDSEVEPSEQTPEQTEASTTPTLTELIDAVKVGSKSKTLLSQTAEGVRAFTNIDNSDTRISETDNSDAGIFDTLSEDKPSAEIIQLGFDAEDSADELVLPDSKTVASDVDTEDDQDDMTAGAPDDATLSHILDGSDADDFEEKNPLLEILNSESAGDASDTPDVSDTPPVGKSHLVTEHESDTRESGNESPNVEIATPVETSDAKADEEETAYSALSKFLPGFARPSEQEALFDNDKKDQHEDDETRDDADAQLDHSSQETISQTVAKSEADIGDVAREDNVKNTQDSSNNDEADTEVHLDALQVHDTSDVDEVELTERVSDMRDSDEVVPELTPQKDLPDELKETATTSSVSPIAVAAAEVSERLDALMDTPREKRTEKPIDDKLDENTSDAHWATLSEDPDLDTLALEAESLDVPDHVQTQDRDQRTKFDAATGLSDSAEATTPLESTPVSEQMLIDQLREDDAIREQIKRESQFNVNRFSETQYEPSRPATGASIWSYVSIVLLGFVFTLIGTVMQLLDTSKLFGASSSIVANVIAVLGALLLIGGLFYLVKHVLGRKSITE